MYADIEILLVEDSLHDAELAIRALAKRNLANKIIHARDGAEALEYLFGNDNSLMPRLILLDLKMPKVDGMEVLERLKADERTRYIPVVVMTSSSEHPDIQRCYELGANSYIVKPVEFDNFSKAVSDAGFYWVLLNQAPGHIEQPSTEHNKN